VSGGESLSKADRLGLIRFGSRVDIYLPPGSVRIVATKGQKLHAGVTCIAEVSDACAE
jgi:phosphatidylserine decarboxylase